MTQYTENYRLELYEGTDKADLTDQYNVSMGILDEAMKGVVNDTDASVAGIRADLATTNSNLNATNINLAALDQKVDSNQTAQATTNLNFQNEIDALKTTVDKNTPLVEEHVNYFAQLGVTDEESATNLHTQINQTQETADDALAQSVENAADIAKLSLEPKQSNHIQNARVVLNSAPSGFNGSMEKVYEYTVGPLLFFGLKFVSEPYSSAALSFNKILFDDPGIFAKNGDIPCGSVSGGVYFKKTRAAYVNDVRPFTDMQLQNNYVLVTAAATSYTPTEDDSSLHVVANFCMIVSPTTEPDNPNLPTVSDTLNGSYPIALSGARNPATSNSTEAFEIKGTITYTDGTVSGVNLTQGNGLLCSLKSENPAYFTTRVSVTNLEITGQHLPDAMAFTAQFFQDNVRGTANVSFTKSGDKLVAPNFTIDGDRTAASEGFASARLSFIYK